MNDRAASPRLRAVPAVSRAVAMLRLLSRAEAPMGVQAIARALGVVPSTCLHILRVLADEGLIAVDPQTKRYSLDVGVLALARGALARGGLAALVQPQLDLVARTHGVTAIAVKVVGLRHMVVQAISRGETGLHLHVDVGSRFPALISATGRCLAAFGDHDPDEIRTRFAQLRWHRAPPWDVWQEEVAAARRDGWSIDDSNYIAGIAIHCAPVLDAHGHMTHGIVSVGVSEQMPAEARAALAAELKRIAAAFSGM